MHVRDLVELAGVMALHGPAIIRGRDSFSQAQVEQYWAASKRRLEHWQGVLKRPASRDAGSLDAHDDGGAALHATLDEIFVGEILTRVASAVWIARDRLRPANVDEPIVRHVLAAHVEARHRALRLLVHPRRGDAFQARAINQIRRRAERWTDLLIGGLLGEADLGEFAFQPDRAADFAEELSRRGGATGVTSSWSVAIASLRRAFSRDLCPAAANPEANARIAASMLGCLGDRLDEATDLFPSLWMVRLAAVAGEAHGMIADLLRHDGKAPHDHNLPHGVFSRPSSSSSP